MVQMITSLTDFVNRQTLAANHKLLSGVGGMYTVQALGLPPPEYVTNIRLQELQPFYIDLLRNIRNTKDNILAKSIHSDEKMMLLLFVLSYPLQIFTVRREPLNITGSGNICVVREQFELTDIVEQILSSKPILTYCRKAIADSGTHHISIAYSSICILEHLSDPDVMTSTYKARKYIRKIILENKPFDEGFLAFRNDLSSLMQRDDTYDADGKAYHLLVFKCINFQGNLLACVNENGTDISNYKSSHQYFDKVVYGRALDRIRPLLHDDGNYKYHHMIVFGLDSATKQDKNQIRKTFAINDSIKGIEKPVIVCGWKRCGQQLSVESHSKSRCKNCKAISYCSRVCQKKNYQQHKKVCQGQTF